MMSGVPHPLDMTAAADWINTRVYAGRLGFCVGIFAIDGRLIGTLSIGGTPTRTVYFIDPDHWHQGYATEALRGFLAQCFVQFDLGEIDAGAMADNPASQAVLKKLGFVHVGTAQGTSFARVEPATETLYRLSRTVFEAAR